MDGCQPGRPYHFPNICPISIVDVLCIVNFLLSALSWMRVGLPEMIVQGHFPHERAAGCLKLDSIFLIFQLKTVLRCSHISSDHYTIQLLYKVQFLGVGPEILTPNGESPFPWRTSLQLFPKKSTQFSWRFLPKKGCSVVWKASITNKLKLNLEFFLLLVCHPWSKWLPPETLA